MNGYRVYYTYVVRLFRKKKDVVGYIKLFVLLWEAQIQNINRFEIL